MEKHLDYNGRQIKTETGLYWRIQGKKIEGVIGYNIFRLENELVFKIKDSKTHDSYPYDKNYIYEIVQCNVLWKIYGYFYRLFKHKDLDIVYLDDNYWKVREFVEGIKIKPSDEEYAKFLKQFE